MTSIKFNKISRICKTARYPRTFRARVAAIPAGLAASLTAAQIAAVIDGPMEASYSAGHGAGYQDAK
jgi:hypothetical protein